MLFVFIIHYLPRGVSRENALDEIGAVVTASICNDDAPHTKKWVIDIPRCDDVP